MHNRRVYNASSRATGSAHDRTAMTDHSSSSGESSVNSVEVLSTRKQHNKLTEAALDAHSQQHRLSNTHNSTNTNDTHNSTDQPMSITHTKDTVITPSPHQSYAQSFYLDGYTNYEKIFESRHTLVFKAVRSYDELPVVIKTPNVPNPGRHRLSQFALQYELLKSLESHDIDGVIYAYDLIPINDSLALVTEYFNGSSLHHLVNNNDQYKYGMDLIEFLQLAISISKTLGEVHNNGIIHKDVTASNILYDTVTQQSKLIDFGLASVYSM